jgi:hypothetical protein
MKSCIVDQEKKAYSFPRTVIIEATNIDMPIEDKRVITANKMK